MHPDDTIVALSSAPGPGARAVARLSGPDTRRITTQLFGKIPDEPRQFHHGSLKLSGVLAPIPARLFFFQKPRSYTGQDLAEFHLVSSPPLLDRLIADILAAGARPAGPGEFTQRAFLAGKLDLTRAEAVQAVIESRSDDDLRTALAQLAGNVARPLDALRDDLLSLLADIEAGLDFVAEDIQFVGQREVLLRLSAALAHLANLRRQLEQRTHSGATIRLVLAGPPNAGKSSLFNALAGRDAAIVSPVPGTTRDYLAAAIQLGGVHVELIDTAGLRPTGDAIEHKAGELGQAQWQTADLLLLCAEPGIPFTTPPAGIDVLRVRTKADLHPQIESACVAASAISPGGLDELRRVLAERVQALARPPLAPSAGRCRHLLDAAADALRRAHACALNEDPGELLALDVRTALDRIGEMVGTVHTNDLLDRIFSRFCIGK